VDDFRKITYGVLIGFILMLVIWISLLTSLGCGFSLSCRNAIPTAERTSIPTLVPATLPAPTRLLGAATLPVVGATQGGTQVAGGNEAARPSNPGGPGPALNLAGDPVAGQQIYVANCQICHGTDGEGGNPNPGSDDGTIPVLNPIDPTIQNADLRIFVTNIDLFMEHGSTPSGTNPSFSMPAWGDKKQLTPQQIADVISYVISLNPQLTAMPTPSGTQAAGGNEAAKPSNPGGPGPALNLTGDPAAGQEIFVASCQICHGTDGKGGNPNPGSDDGTIPALNPIDPTIKNADLKVFATNIDLFMEHGSTPSGANPSFSMPAWGDKKQLTPQQIANVIAYVISLNPQPAASATSSGTQAAAPASSSGTPAAAANETSEPAEEAAKPSNPGGPGPALNLKGDPASGQQISAANCQICHGADGKGGNPNPGSDDGTIPALNPIDPTINSADPKTFAINIDLFVEHGSTPSGPNPTFSMIAWGDKNLLTPQQIADVIAYVMSLNK
jgi:mono/diheme cytochrome c family protein